MWWVATGVAAAQPAVVCDEALDASGFRASVFDAQSAIDRGDIELTAGIVDGLLSRLPCLDHPVEPSLWAELLVSWSVVEYSRGGWWEGPLASALRLRKAIDRGVGPGHPIFAWEPPPEPAWGEPIPPKTRLWVDGRPTPTLPPGEGVYLAQKTDGRFWNSRLLVDEPLPLEWVTGPVTAPPRVVAWTRLGASFGVASLHAEPDWASNRFVSGSATGWPIGATADVHATFFSPFGVAGTGRVSWFPRSPGLDGRVQGIVERGPLVVGGGLGLTLIDVFQGEEGGARTTDDDADTTTSPVRYGLGSLAVHPRHRLFTDGGRAFDAAITAGGSPGGTMADLEVGVAGAVAGGQVFRLGALGSWRRGTTTWTGVPGGTIEADSFRLLLRVDFVLGEY